MQSKAENQLKVDVDYKTLQQVIREAEETRRRSIEIQEKLYDILRLSDSPNFNVKEDDVVAIRRGKDQQVVGVTVPRLEGKPVPKIKNVVETIFTRPIPEIKVKGKKVPKADGKRPKTIAASTRVKTPGKIASTQSLKNVNKSKGSTNVGSSKIKTIKPKRASVDSEKKDLKGIRTSKTKTAGKGTKRVSIDTKQVGSQEPIKEEDEVETNRPDTATNALRKSKELLESIGRRGQLPDDAQQDIQTYLEKLGRRAQII